MRCPRCGYEWSAKVPNPKECPRCKSRLDYSPGPPRAPKFRIEKKEVEKGMSGRLPWVAATIVIVIAAGLGAWALTQPTLAPATFSVGELSVFSNGTLVGRGWTQGQSGWQGIENIFLIKYDKGDNTRAFDDQSENWLSSNSVINENGQSINVPYEQYFDIVVDVTLYAPDNLAYASKENLYVYMKWSGYTTGSDNSFNEPSSAKEFVYDGGGGGTSGYVKVNVRFNNGGAHWKIPAASQLSLDEVKLFGWK
ncbi:MAG: hypothetical protein QXG38_00915 [Candidatus Hadarchaeales archaeon]